MIADQPISSLDCRVLVLNKHYMALRVVGVRRAFSLLFKEQAEVISCERGSYFNYDFQSWRELGRMRDAFEPDHDWISTVNFDIAVPRVIRLLFYDRLPRTPVKLGGKSTWENVVCACTRCNVKKGGRTPRQAGMKLVTKPVKPRRNPVIGIHLKHNRYRSWKQFLDHAYWSVELT